ncbi:TonB-dependent receptor plug domain-containing protein [Parasphingorhabdus halotolerans]|uniref:TonB-dependent receptor plug domain-containing protein n=1 Tax=Parasphingorhabdus halotolerans TaxID=2725558 RepID=A0A6H2DN49_9SPHN|nr:TonB-dependent receptor plug domain-containing protein [Parasphingorhabdus halotolerans]
MATNLQPRSENDRQIYDAEQFKRFNPRTALDMVGQVPGFTIDTGDTDERGLGQADENVLINGQRISGKNIDAFIALRRISADSVVRIEIVDGATLSISGLSGQVLNLVTKVDENKGISGNFRWRPQWRRAGNNWFAGDASITGPLGKGEFTLSIENDAFRNGVDGPEQVIDRFGNLLFERDEIARVRGDRPKFSAAYASTSDAGSVFNLNASYGLNHFTESVDTLRTQSGQPDIFEFYSSREREWNAEISGDYEFALGGGRLKLVGLQRLEHSPFNNFFGQTFTDGITPANGSQFDQTVDEGESVVRAEYNWKTGGGTDWGISLEGAYNFLENEGSFSSFANPVVTPLGNTKVTEYRGELIGSYGRPLSEQLTLQATLGGEYSKISQSGARGQTRSFIRPKGSVSLSWKPQDDLDVSLKLERKVGQLNFFDFVESVDVANNANNAGNPGLVPPQTWRAELEATQKLGPWGSMTVNIYGEKITDIVDSIPITATTEARGNLPKATRYGVSLTSSILFDSIGWTGAKLDIQGEVRKSSVRDPLLGNFRRTNDDKIFTYEISLRHDIPNSDWAWGGGAEDFRFSNFLRLDQINNFKTGAPYTWIFVEHKDVLGLTVKADLGNLLGRSENFTRTVYGQLLGQPGDASRGFIPGRRDGPIGFIEDRSRDFGLIYRITVSGSF